MLAHLGVVRSWNDAEGWGVVDSEATPGGCWVHWSFVLTDDHRTLECGQAVRFTYEAGERDGYSFRALEVWPDGQNPARTVVEQAESSAYRSTLSITSEDEGPHERR